MPAACRVAHGRRRAKGSTKIGMIAGTGKEKIPFNGRHPQNVTSFDPFGQISQYQYAGQDTSLGRGLKQLAVVPRMVQKR